MTYKATLGTTSTIITIGVSLLLGLISGLLVYQTISANEITLTMITTFVIIAISALYMITYLYRPTQYIVDATHLTIKRPIRHVKIPIHEIKDAFTVRKEAMKWTERMGGNGGLFGFYGNFKNDFGRMTWYATKLKNYIMIETVNDGRIILTPDDTDMIKELRRLIGK